MVFVFTWRSFSPGYAESKHCLRELCAMLKSGKEVLPVFYGIEPAHLANIQGGPFEVAFREHVERGRGEQIVDWMAALSQISKVKGFRLDGVNGNEVKFISEIIVELQAAMGRYSLERQRGSNPISPPKVQTGDQRLNVLVLGDPKSVKDVIGIVCGRANCQPTLVQDHPKFTENLSAQPAICLYSASDTTGVYNDIKTFVKKRNENWHRTKVEALWAYEVEHQNPRKWTSLNPELRLHTIWLVCREPSDLPDSFQLSQITKLDLPLKILVIHDSRTEQGIDFRATLGLRSNFDANAEKAKELIVEFSLEDEGLKEMLWRVCWVAKTRADIRNAAKIIREIRKQLGSEGKSSPVGVGSGGIIRKDVSLRRSGEFLFNFLCAYWNIPVERVRRVLIESTTFKQPEGKENFIESSEFVKFCLTVAAVILYASHVSAGEPGEVGNWDLTGVA